MTTMYAPQNNSPRTTLAAAIGVSDTTVTVADGSVLPDAPNVLTLGVDENAELVLMTSKTDNILTVERGFNGTIPAAWPIETWIYRAITAQDISALQDNVTELDTNKATYPTAPTEGNIAVFGTGNELQDSGLSPTFLKTASNPNLLDNWYFVDPIDQRQGYVVLPDTPYYSDTGLTTQAGTVSAYTTATNVDGTYGTITVDSTTYYVAWSAAVRGYADAGYTIDRWKMWVDVGTILVEEDGLLFDASDNAITFSQSSETSLINSLAGKTVTLSILYTAVTNLTYDTAIMTQMEGSVQNHVRLNIEAGVTDCRSTTFTFDGAIVFPAWLYVGYGEKIKVHSVKFELGSTQTLAHQDENGNWVLNDPPPDKGLELAKCQRYQIIWPSWIRVRSTFITTDYIDFIVPHPVMLRLKPNIDQTKLHVATYVHNPVDAEVEGFTFLLKNETAEGSTIRATKTSHGLTDAVLYSDPAMIFDANL